MKNLNLQILAQSYRQLYAAALLEDEIDGARKINALNKAYTEILENPTIEFADGVLGFVSRTSKETRFVTSAGCAPLYCRCRGEYSYHTALFAILTRYAQLEAEAAPVEYIKLPKIEPSYLPNTSTKPREKCGRFFI